jgi:hypothetical protein
MSIFRLTGGTTPANAADPRSFPTIWNDTADDIEAGDYSKVPTGGTAGQVLTKQSATDFDAVFQLLKFASSGMQSGRYEFGAGTNTTLTVTNGTLIISPFFFAGPVSIDRLGVQVATAGGSGSVIRLGIYASTDTLLPGSLILDAGTVDGTTTGSKEITVAESLAAGMYWVGAVGQGTPSPEPVLRARTGIIVPTLNEGNNPNQNAQGGLAVAGVTGALDATYSWLTNGNLQRPAVFVRIA